MNFFSCTCSHDMDEHDAASGACLHRMRFAEDLERGESPDTFTFRSLHPKGTIVVVCPCTGYGSIIVDDAPTTCERAPTS